MAALGYDHSVRPTTFEHNILNENLISNKTQSSVHHSVFLNLNIHQYRTKTRRSRIIFLLKDIPSTACNCVC